MAVGVAVGGVPGLDVGVGVGTPGGVAVGVGVGVALISGVAVAVGLGVGEGELIEVGERVGSEVWSSDGPAVKVGTGSPVEMPVGVAGSGVEPGTDVSGVVGVAQARMKAAAAISQGRADLLISNPSFAVTCPHHIMSRA